MKLTKKRKKLLLTGVAAFAMLGIGTIFYHVVEGMSWIDATYFTTMTLATVGYGDHVPVTPEGKIFTIGFVIVGITIMISLLDTVAHIRVSEHMEKFIERVKSHPEDNQEKSA